MAELRLNPSHSSSLGYHTSYFKVPLWLSIQVFNETARRKYSCASATETEAMSSTQGLLWQPTGTRYLINIDAFSCNNVLCSEVSSIKLWLYTLFTKLSQFHSKNLVLQVHVRHTIKHWPYTWYTCTCVVRYYSNTVYWLRNIFLSIMWWR